MSMPDWAVKLPWDIIYKESQEHDLDPKLIAAFIQVESSGNPLAYRYEEHWPHAYNIAEFAKGARVTISSEEMAQKTSIGILQVMGTVARELGHRKSLAELYKTEVGLHWGMEKINLLKMKYDNIKDVISAYNLGTPRKDKSGKYVNQSYVDKVLYHYREL